MSVATKISLGMEIENLWRRDKGRRACCFGHHAAESRCRQHPNRVFGRMAPHNSERQSERAVGVGNEALLLKTLFDGNQFAVKLVELAFTSLVKLTKPHVFGVQIHNELQEGVIPLGQLLRTLFEASSDKFGISPVARIVDLIGVNFIELELKILLFTQFQPIQHVLQQCSVSRDVKISLGNHQPFYGLVEVSIHVGRFTIEIFFFPLDGSVVDGIGNRNRLARATKTGQIHFVICRLRQFFVDIINVGKQLAITLLAFGILFDE